MKFTKETLKRTIRTFIQALVAYLIVALPAVDFTAEKEVLKSTLLGLGASALAAGLSAVMNLEKPEQLGGSSGMSFSEWIKKYLGKKTDYDGVYGVQCVDLIDCYIDRCLGLKKGFWGNAKEWWIRRNSNEWLKKNFEFVTPKYKNGELKKGDIGIRTSGTYGHIFIVAGPTADGKIKYYDQNADGKGAAMTLRSKPYTSSYINGVLRPKDRSNIELIKTVKANGGLNAYTSLTASKSSLLIPDGAKIDVINLSSGKKKIKGITYTMAKVIYKSRTYYVASKYLK